MNTTSKTATAATGLNSTTAPGLTGTALKLIAVISMIIDHTGRCIVYFIPGRTEEGTALYYIYKTMRIVGRLAFPLYLFLLLEGMIYTKSRIKYVIRLFIFVLISEVPFDLAMENSILEWTHQNVYLTLLLGALMLWLFEKIRAGLVDRLPEWLIIICVFLFPTAYFTWRIGKDTKAVIGWSLETRFAYPICAVLSLALIYGMIRSTLRKKDERTAMIMCTDLIVMSGFAYVADLVKCDYKSAGIIALALMYLYRYDFFGRMVSATLALTMLSSSMEIVCLLNVPLVERYNGKRGHGLKYLFYIIYPAHLLILYLISYLTGYRGSIL